jgi:hypothetical protein
MHMRRYESRGSIRLFNTRGASLNNNCGVVGCNTAFTADKYEHDNHIRCVCASKFRIPAVESSRAWYMFSGEQQFLVLEPFRKEQHVLLLMSFLVNSSSRMCSVVRESWGGLYSHLHWFALVTGIRTLQRHGNNGSNEQHHMLRNRLTGMQRLVSEIKTLKNDPNDI